MPETKAIFMYFCEECGTFMLDVRKQIEKSGEVPEYVKCPKCGRMAERPF
jgi:DNA-directed RNA polymerase subunit M/transcription elongation factor TFIIS